MFARHPVIHGALVLALVSGGIGLGLAAPSAAQTPAYRVFQASSDQFNNPRAIARDGTHVWVLDAGSGAVTELDESNGALVRVISGLSYQLAYAQFSPLADSIYSDGTDVWVASPDDNSITEIDASTGALVRVISGFDVPLAVFSDGTHVWVGNWSGSSGVSPYPSQGSVTELDAATGAVVQVIGAADGEVGSPQGICSDGPDIWVLNGGYWTGTAWTTNNLTELDASTGAPVRAISTPFGLALSCDLAHVWVTDGSLITEVDASTGAVAQTIHGSGYGLADSRSLSSDGTHVWVASIQNNAVLEFDASTGAFVQELSDPGLELNGPMAIRSDGAEVWVANSAGNSVTAMSAGAGQSITFTSTPPATSGVGEPPYTVTALGGASGNPVTFSIDAASASICSISGQSVSFTGLGTCIVDADQAGGNGYPAALQAQQSFFVGAQAITFTSTPPTDAQVSDPAYTVTATGGGSGNPVIFTVDPAAAAVCSISGPVVSFTNSGTCTVDANQAGSTDYLPAPQAQQSFLVGDPPIRFTSAAPSDAIVRGPTYTVSATGAPSGVPVTFSSGTTSVCTVVGSTVSFIGAGTCTIDAEQAGNAQYLPSSGTQSFGVTNVQALNICTATTMTVGVPYSCQITTTGGPVPTVSKLGSLPLGVTFVNNHDGSATIAGTPGLNTGKVYTVKVTAVFGSLTTKKTVSATVALTVDQPPRFTTTASKTTYVGQAFTFTVRTKAYPAPVITLASGVLPSGVTFTDLGNGTASLAGTPAAGTAGTYSVTITAANGIGSVATQNFKLVVKTL